MARDPAAVQAVSATGARSVIVGRDNYGLINTGEVHLHFGSEDGALVDQLPLLARPRIRARRKLEAVAPAFENHVDREQEIARVAETVANSRTLNIHGDAGIGKTYLMVAASGDLAHTPTFGPLYLIARNRHLNDILQQLFDGFFSCQPEVRLPDAQLRAQLSRRAGLVLLDALELEREDAEELTASLARDSRILVASRSRVLWQGPDILLHGLEPAAAVALIEQELGRPLDDHELDTAASICSRLAGHPLKIREAAMLARDHGLTAIAARLRTAPPDRQQAVLLTHVLESLSDQQLRLLATLKALDGASIGSERLAALTTVDEVDELLDDPQRLGLVESHSPRWSATMLLTDAEETRLRLLRESERELVSTLLSWTTGQATPSEIAEEVDALLAALRLADKNQQPKELIQLGRAVEPAVIQAKRWDAWEALLLKTRAAAHATGDRASEGWALHELGTRALALGRRAAAVELLLQAESVRRELEDQPGLVVTRHNLRIARRPVPWMHRMINRWFLTVPLPLLLAVAAIVALVLTGGIAAAVIPGHNRHHRPNGGGAVEIELQIRLHGNGKGVVRSVPGGVRCPPRCQGSFGEYATVTLIATSGPGSEFLHWQNCAPLSRQRCSPDTLSDETVIATFALRIGTQMPVLSLSAPHAHFTSSHAPRIDCPSVCRVSVAKGSTIVLTATPDDGYKVTAWNNCPEPRGAQCTITVDTNETVEALTQSINPTPVTLTVNATNARVTSDKSGIDCPSACRVSVAKGSTIVLTATPDDGYKVTAWNNCPAPTADGSTCKLTIEQDEGIGVTATSIPAHTLSVSTTNSETGASGTVNIAAGQTTTPCAASCKSSFQEGTKVTLEAIPAASSTFDHWEGDACVNTSGTTCSFTVMNDTNVTAVFRLPHLSVTVSGGGLVISSLHAICRPANAQTSNTCTFPVAKGKTITIFANAGGSGNIVANVTWVGCDATSDKDYSCATTLNSDRRITANITSRSA